MSDPADRSPYNYLSNLTSSATVISGPSYLWQKLRETCEDGKEKVAERHSQGCLNESINLDFIKESLRK